jgi:tetratricopeptide (TPR) repeat protein
MKRLSSLLFLSLFFLLAPCSWAQTPASAKDFVNRCLALYKQQAWDEAIAACSKAIELDPKSRDAYAMRAIILRDGKGNLDGALADFGKAIEIDPHPELYRGRGLTKYIKNDFDGAIADFNVAIEKDPSAANYNGRGLARFLKGDLDGAVKDLSAAIEKSPASVDLYMVRAKARYIKKDWDGTIADYSMSIKLNPKFPAAYAGRGLALLMNGKDVEAQKDFDKFLEIAPDKKVMLEDLIKEAKRERTTKK